MEALSDGIYVHNNIYVVIFDKRLRKSKVANDGTLQGKGLEIYLFNGWD